MRYEELQVSGDVWERFRGSLGTDSKRFEFGGSAFFGAINTRHFNRITESTQSAIGKSVVKPDVETFARTGTVPSRVRVPAAYSGYGSSRRVVPDAGAREVIRESGYFLRTVDEMIRSLGRFAR